VRACEFKGVGWTGAKAGAEVAPAWARPHAAFEPVREKKRGNRLHVVDDRVRAEREDKCGQIERCPHVSQISTSGGPSRPGERGGEIYVRL
jgi:hypothetical protein